MHGRNIFVSYKYHDDDVEPLKHVKGPTTCRNYVDEIESILKDDTVHKYRGERNDADLSDLSEEKIQQMLADEIFYTSVTIVLISRGMREPGVPEICQWMPWEISYSLRRKNRKSGRSEMNAVLAVAVPDRNGFYDHAIERTGTGRDRFRTENFFDIISENMLNLKKSYIDRNGNPRKDIDRSYIPLVRWRDFRSNPEHCIGIAMDHRQNEQSYTIVKTLTRTGTARPSKPGSRSRTRTPSWTGSTASPP